MTLNYKEMVTGQVLTGSPVIYYTAPALTQASITAVSITNATGAPVTVNLYKVPAAGAANTGTRIASRSLAAGSTLSMPDAINHKLAPGTRLYADGLACTLNISGVEFIPST
jgi:hypothetical protein